MGNASSAQKRVRPQVNVPDPTSVPVNQSDYTGNSNQTKIQESDIEIAGATPGEGYEMGTRAVKANVEDNEMPKASKPHEIDMAAQERHFAEWRHQMNTVVDRLQSEAAEKDARIARLAKQAKELSLAYEKQKQNGEKHSNKSELQLIETLKEHILRLQESLNEKDEVIRSLQRQLLQSRSDKESQVSVVKDTVEMVIREKDSEIRRLKALWTPSDALPADLLDVTIVEDVSRATKLLNAREVGPGKKNTRFGISAENRTSSSRSLQITVQPEAKTLAQKLFIRKALNTNVFMKSLDTKQVDQLIECMSQETISRGLDVISEGEFGTHLFVLETGQVEVYRSKGGAHNHVVDLKTGTIFGELAILYNCKRTASVRAKTDVVLWSLERKNFQSAVKRTGQLKREEYIRLLRTVDKLKSLSDNKLMRIADCLEETTFNKGDYIIRQGDSGDTFYVIQDGKVKVTHTEIVNEKTKECREEFVCHLETGEYFGESALLTEDKRSANIIVESRNITVLMLDRQAFISLIGTIADVSRTPSHPQVIPLDSNFLDADHGVPHKLTTVKEEDSEGEDVEDVLHIEEVDASAAARRVTITARLSKATEAILQRTPLKDLKALRVLGQGGFGCVKLVSVPGLPKCAFALKSIRKAKIVKTGQQQHVLAEKNILLAIKCNFIGRLYRTYKDEWRVYMLMDAYLGGEVYGVLKRHGPLNDGSAQFCAGCVLEALDFLHQRGIVYRDLKPENLMLDHKGYVKLVDFGFAKRVRFGFKTWTFCGTPEYFPPEILANLGHDFSADFWSFGILVYELLTRTTPFYASDDMTVYENILSGIEGVKFSRRVNKSAEVMIRGLCKLEPRDRLGYQKGGVNDIRKQRWFQGFDWQGLRATRIKSPFQPDVKSPTDTKNFEPVFEEPIDEEEDMAVLANAKLGWDETF